jgi:low temperature requirement protein LtrA
MHYHAAHLSERFGAFVLIALGESVVSIGAPAAAARRLDAATLAAVTFAFALCCGAWWVYFHFASDAMRHALATAQVQLHVTRHVLSYGHLLLIASIVAVAVGMTDTISQPAARLHWPVAGLLYGGSALYLATFGYTRWMMFRLVSTTRLSAAGVGVVCLPIATSVPALASLGLLAAIFAGLNIVELMMVRSQRRQAASATS